MAMRATPSIKAAAMIIFIRTLLDSDGCRAMASMAADASDTYTCTQNGNTSANRCTQLGKTYTSDSL
jgi:hypothetical protein